MATQEQILGALRRHAILSVAIERANAMGRPVPRETAMEVQRIEADLHSVLPASMAQEVANFQEQVKSDLLRMEANGYSQAMHVQRSEALAKIATQRDRGARAVTQSINDGNNRTGLNMRQMSDALAKGKFRTEPPLHAREVYRAEVAVEGGGYIDPKAFMREWTKAFDAPDDSPTRERFLDAIGVKGDRSDRRRFFDQLSTEMLQTEMSARRDDRALKDDANAFKSRVHEVSPSDARRLDVTAATLKALPKPGNAGLAGMMMNRVSESSLRDEGMRGDIARSMADHTGQQSYGDLASDLHETVEAATSETLV